MVEAYVCNRDVACPTCKYNLRDLTSGVCPECGETPVLRLQAEHPQVGILVLGLLPLTMGLGFFGIAGVTFVVLSMYFGDWAPGFYWVAPLIIAGVCGLATRLWIARWTRVRRWRLGRRIALLLPLWLGLFVLVTAYLYIAIVVAW